MKKNEFKDMISIVVPAYNSENVIRPCIESILKSSYKNFELIIINDGSKDNTLKIIKEYAEKDNRIKIIDKKNAGQAEARNDGINIAKGEYIMFIDADDFVEEDYLELMLNEIRSKKQDICISGYKNYNVDYKYTGEVRYLNEYWTRFYACVVWAKIYKTSFIKDNNLFFPNIKNGEDTAFTVTALSKTEKISVINNTGFGHYYNTTGLSRFTFKGFELNIVPANQYIKDNVSKEYEKNHEKYMWYFYIKHSIFYILWSGKCETPKRFIEKNKELFYWLEKNNTLFKNHKVTSIFFPKGEKLSTRIVIFIYTLLNKIHLIPLFAYIFCKGKEK